MPATGTLECTEDCPITWLVVPCHRNSLRFLSHRENVCCFIGKQLRSDGTERDVFVVRDDDFCGRLVCDDFPEGPETHLSRRQKRALLNSLEKLSTVLPEGPKGPSQLVSSGEPQEPLEELDSKQERRQEPKRPDKKVQDPKGQSKEERTIARPSFCRPRRSDAVDRPSSAELRAQRISCLRPCCHGDLVNMGRRPPKILELFSPPRLSLRALEAGLETTKPSNLDLTSGWDALQWRDRKKMWQILEEQKPDVVIMSPDCRMFSQLMNVNLERIPIERLTRDQMQALVMWQLCLQVADYQLQRGRSFVLEQPGGASSWQTHGAQWLSKQDQVHHFLFDQCELGLRVTPTGLSRKTTGLMTNHLGVAFLLSQYQCTKSHGHVPLESGLPSWTASLEAHQSLLDDVLADEDDDEDMGERQPRTPGTLHRDSSESLTVEQKKKIELLHCNMGHLSRDQMLLMLRAANAKEGVLKYVRDRFQCSSCMRQRKPVERRLAAVPRTFAFNRIVALDYFFLSFSNRTYAFLNAVCHGTNYQQVGLLRSYDGGVPSSVETWRLFHRMWVQPYGIPETLICDGGSEFKLDFERKTEQHGILQIITDAASPWQNGKVERHGGWVKERAELEVASGQGVVTNEADLEELVLSMVACKNRWYSRGGYSPCQLVWHQSKGAYRAAVRRSNARLGLARN